MKSQLHRARQMTGERSVNGITTFRKEEYDEYQESLSSKKEWPGLNIRSGEVSLTSFLIYFLAEMLDATGYVAMSILISDSQTMLNIPMLIMELYRLVPYKKGRYVQFHPFNMPNVEVRKIELVGTVTNITCNVNNLFLTSKTLY